MPVASSIADQLQFWRADWPERRREPRFDSRPTQLVNLLLTTAPGDELFVRAEVLDMSSGGACFAVGGSIPVEAGVQGSVVDPLPGQANAGQLFEVRWVDANVLITCMGVLFREEMP